MNVKHYYNHWFPPLLGATAVTIGNNIYYAKDNPPKWLVEHELTHVRQYNKYGIVGFLCRYIGEYMIGRFKGLGRWDSYSQISFEIEAELKDSIDNRHEYKISEFKAEDC